MSRQPPQKPGATPPPRPETPAPTVWHAVNPPEWAPPVGYANAVVSRGTTRVAVAGQIAFGPDAKVRHPGDLVAQAALAFDNVVTVLAAAGAKPDHVVRLRLFVTSAADYAKHAAEIGRAYRALFGRWFPAMTLVEVARLYEAAALIEVEADAEVP